MGYLSCELGTYFGCVGDSLRARGCTCWTSGKTMVMARDKKNGALGTLMATSGNAKGAVASWWIVTASFSSGYSITRWTLWLQLLVFVNVFVHFGCVTVFIWRLTYPYVFICRLTYPYVFGSINVLVHFDWTWFIWRLTYPYVLCDIAPRFLAPCLIYDNAIDSSMRAAKNKLSNAASTISIPCKISDLSA